MGMPYFVLLNLIIYESVSSDTINFFLGFWCWARVSQIQFGALIFSSNEKFDIALSFLLEVSSLGPGYF